MTAAPCATPRGRRRGVQDAIRGAAIRKFAASGLAGASARAIVARAGPVGAPPHSDIGTEEELCGKVLMAIVAEWRAIFLSADQFDLATAIAPAVRRKLRGAPVLPGVARLVASEIGRGAPPLRRRWRPARRAVEDGAAAIRGRAAEGRIVPIDPSRPGARGGAPTGHGADPRAQVRVLPHAGDAPLDAAPTASEVIEMLLRRCGPGAPCREARR